MRGSRWHALALMAWLLSIIPTVLWWRDSLIWIALASVWTNIAFHSLGWAASRATRHERQGHDHDEQGDPLPWLADTPGPRHATGPHMPRSEACTEAIILPITPRMLSF